MIPAQQVAAILGGPKALGHPVSNLMDLDAIVAQGIPKHGNRLSR